MFPPSDGNIRKGSNSFWASSWAGFNVSLLTLNLLEIHLSYWNGRDFYFFKKRVLTITIHKKLLTNELLWFFPLFPFHFNILDILHMKHLEICIINVSINLTSS